MFLIKTLSHEKLKFNVFILKPKLEQLHLQEKKTTYLMLHVSLQYLLFSLQIR